jgi:hypothetical protein
MGFLMRLLGREEEAGWQTTVAAGAPVVHTQTQNVVLTGDEARQAMEAIESATGMDLDGDGRVGGAGGPAAVPGGQVFGAGGPAGAPMTGAGGDDVVSQLERLARLHESGALTAEEFARQKARLLGGP